MTHAIKHTMHFLLVAILSAMALVCNSYAQAQDAGLAGTWQLERATDVDGLVSNLTTDLPPTLQVLGDRFVMPSGCLVQLISQPIAMDRIFQNLLKADASKADIESYYQKQYKLSIQEVRASFRNAPQTAACYREVVYLLQRGDTLVASEGGGQFSFLYKRIAPMQGAAGEGPYSQLPFQITSYDALCPKAITWSNRKPVGVTKRCAPL